VTIFKNKRLGLFAIKKNKNKIKDMAYLLNLLVLFFFLLSFCRDVMDQFYWMILRHLPVKKMQYLTKIQLEVLK
jgi:hypothetical protein